jgi:hypothetical protein
MRMIWVGVALGGLLAIGALVTAVGMALPADHVAAGEILVPAPVSQVAALVRDVEQQPRWRRGVTAIADVARAGTAIRYVEVAGSQRTAFRMTEDAPDRLFTTAIADPDLPYSGSWTIALAPEGGATRVRIEERGTVRNPLFRFVSTLLIGHERTLRAYLDDLVAAAGRHGG